LTVNGMATEAQKGETLLSVLDRMGIRVPTLCSMKGLSPTGACRMCVVEVEGLGNLVPACSFPVEDDLSVSTHSPRVMKARKTNVELLLASHPDDCLYCDRNGSCELQQLAEELNVRERRIPGNKRRLPVDRSSPAVVRDPSKCILCGRCVRVCEEIMHTSTLDFAFRGNGLRISTTLGKPLYFSNCTACGQCVTACPTGALTEHGMLDKLLDALHHPGKRVVLQYTPAVAVSVLEQLGLRPDREGRGMFHTLLRQSGVDLVFETSYGATQMIREHAKMIAEREGGTAQLPLISSSCPAWVRYAEQYFPELLSHLSPLRSPQQVLGGMIREWLREHASFDGKKVVTVLATSCTAAKWEANTGPDETPAIDLVISSRELIRLFRILGLEHHQLKPGPSDEPFRSGGSTGILCGVAGGEAEGVIRTLHQENRRKEPGTLKLHRFRIHKPYRELLLESGAIHIRVGAVNGLAHATELLEEVKNGKRMLDFLEVMACPWGCVNGGGQPIPVTETALKTWSHTLYSMAR
jgi:NADH dehydrogenase/NADH:ubiquinone oxidoreductase subunit G